MAEADTEDRPRQDGRSKPRPGIEEQQRIILDAAVTLFAEHGSRAISVSQICQRAGVSRPTFYRCFKDKAELIYTLYQQSVNEPVEQIMLAGLPAEGPDKAHMRRALDKMMDAIFERSRLAELVFVESSNPDSPAHHIVDSAFEHAADELERWLSSGKGRKPSRVLLKAVMAACQWIVHDAIRAGLTEEARAQAKKAAWQLVSSVLRPQRPAQE